MESVTTLPARTQEQRSALSDALMVDAAIALICERGAAGTTLKDVGLHAGYSRGLAGYRFGNKAGLWSFLIRTIGEEWLAELAAAVEGSSGLQTIHAAIDAHCRFLLESSDRIRAFYVLWFESVGPDAELTDVIARIHERRRDDVEAWICAGAEEGEIVAGVDPRLVAEQFVAAIVGIVYRWLVSPADDRLVTRLHDSLRQQMTVALGDRAPAGRTTTNGVSR
jgi:AcrR family transcriptional regulator